MGLLMSDSLLLDPLLDETLRLLDGLGAWAYAPGLARDPSEQEGPTVPSEPVPGGVGASAADPAYQRGAASEQGTSGGG